MRLSQVISEEEQGITSEILTEFDNSNADDNDENFYGIKKGTKAHAKMSRAMAITKEVDPALYNKIRNFN
jgi:hypothetical protein